MNQYKCVLLQSNYNVETTETIETVETLKPL